MALFFAILYAAFCAIHLAACILKKDALCAWTKCTLMPLLAICVIAFALQDGSLSVAVILSAAALLCDAAGDALLLNPSDRAFMAGAACFLLGHIAWILTVKDAVLSVSPKWIVVWALASSALLFLMWRILRKPRGAMGAAVVIYGFSLSALVGAGAAAVRSNAGLPSAMFLAGGILFFISDGVLSYSRFVYDIAHSRFFVMLTYIAALTLLALSVINAA